jgi:hypothetical protein
LYVLLGAQVYQKVFKRILFNFMEPGHGHLDIDQKNSCTSHHLHLQSTLAISPLRFEDALRGSFVLAANKPLVHWLEGVHDWQTFYSGAMAAVGLARLAAPTDGGDAQRSYCIYSDDSDIVRMTFKRRATELEIFPRQLMLGQGYISQAHGAGQVTDTEYNHLLGHWATTIGYHNGAVETIDLPVIGIPMFPNASEVPIGVPRYEIMKPDWPQKVDLIRNNILRCKSKLPIFNGFLPRVVESWDDWFQTQDSWIAASKDDPTGPWYRGPIVYSALAPSAAALVAPIMLPPLPATPAWEFDPVTHVDFTSTQRAAAITASRKPPSLQAGGVVLLRLRHGTIVPPWHTLSVCVATLPVGFVAGALLDGALVDFNVSFTRSTDLSGTWSTVPALSLMSAPLQYILVSGLELTVQRKLFVLSQAKIEAIVPAFDLGMS